MTNLEEVINNRQKELNGLTSSIELIGLSHSNQPVGNFKRHTDVDQFVFFTYESTNALGLRCSPPESVGFFSDGAQHLIGYGENKVLIRKGKDNKFYKF